jgi:hypothetical protein
VYANTIKAEHPERAEQAFELADLFAKQARRRVDELFTAVFANDDAAGYATAQKVLEGRYTWLEEGVADPSGDGPMVAGQPEDIASGEVSTNGNEPVAAAAAG